MAAVGAWIVTAVKAMAANTIGGFALKVGASVALNMAIAKIAMPSGPKPSELQNEGRASNPQRIRHLGRVRTSGTIAFWDWTHVDGQRRLFKLLFVAEGGLQNVVQWYLDGAPVSVNADGYVTTPPWNKGNVRLRFRDGIQGSQWDGGNYADLRAAFPTAWTTDHRARGIGTILATFDAVDGEDIATVYSGGEPEVSALIVGSPQYWPNSNEYAQTRNPAAMLADVVTNPNYGPLAGANVNFSTFATARTACNSDVPTVGGTRPRYIAGISYPLSAPLKDVAGQLLEAMGGGAWMDEWGQIAVEAGVWTAPTVTIEERHIVEMEYGAGTERINRVTTLVPTYCAPSMDWQENPADAVDDVGAIARWGEGEPKSIELIPVQNHAQAAHLCIQKLAKINPRRSMSLTLRAFGLRLMRHRRCLVNIPRLGLNGVPFWITSYRWDGTNVFVELSEADPASFDVLASRDGVEPTMPSRLPAPSLTTVPVVSSVEVVRGSGQPFIQVVGNGSRGPGYVVKAQYRSSGDSTWTDMIRQAVSTGFSFRTGGLGDQQTYDVKVFFSTPITNRPLSDQVFVTGISVVANLNAPNAPGLISTTGTVLGPLTIIFAPDLGDNYRRTGLYRAPPGGAFADATLVRWSYEETSQVTVTATIPAAGGRYFIRSENASGVPSGAVMAGNYAP